MEQEELIIALEELLAESLESVRKREQTTFDKLASPFGQKMVLFGTGGLCRKIIKVLRKIGVEPVALCDNNSSLWGGDVESLTVLSPEDAVKKFANHASFVVTIWSDKLGHPFNEIKEQLKCYGQVKVISFLPLFWKYSEEFLPSFFLDLPSKIIQERDNIIASAKIICDPESRLGFFQNIKSRYQACLEILPDSLDSKKQFNPGFISTNTQEVFVDAGAYNGDTIRTLLNIDDFVFKEIISLEPDPVNYYSLLEYIQKLPVLIRRKIRLLPLALGNSNGVVNFDASGTDQAQISSEGGTAVRCKRIDDLFKDKKISFIKMDIEGAESDALRGAIKTIAEKAPVLVISSYHKPNHLWKLALIIHNINNSYSIYYRPHACGGWDYMLYAIPKNRLKIKK